MRAGDIPAGDGGQGDRDGVREGFPRIIMSTGQVVLIQAAFRKSTDQQGRFVPLIHDRDIDGIARREAQPDGEGAHHRPSPEGNERDVQARPAGVQGRRVEGARNGAASQSFF